MLRTAKELAAINADGCPAGITLAQADDLETWEFELAVLGDETIYKVALLLFKFCGHAS